MIDHKYKNTHANKIMERLKDKQTQKCTDLTSKQKKENFVYVFVYVCTYAITDACVCL